MSEIYNREQAITTMEELNTIISSLKLQKEELLSDLAKREEELNSKLDLISVEIDAKQIVLAKLDEQIKEKTQQNDDLYITYKSLIDENSEQSRDLKDRESKIAIK